jgi:hypothetical protein
MFAYNLNRFSEDIDLDGTNKEKIKEIIDKYCKIYGKTYNVKKDTDTTFRVMLKYNKKKDHLKIEVSFRADFIPKDAYQKTIGIAVYNINNLASMKAMAYMGRNRLRDLFDTTFIVNNYYDQLDSSVRSGIISAFQYKGLDQFDYITSQQSDPLIDPKVLQDSFLNAYDKLGLFVDSPEPETDFTQDETENNITTNKAVLKESSKNSVCDS